MIKTVKDCFLELASHIGLNDFKIDMYYDSSSPSYVLCLDKKFPSIDLNTKNPEEFVDKCFNPLIVSIANSPAVQNSKRELEKENKELSEKIKSLEEQVKTLSPYKTYFELSYKMNHG